MHAIAGMQTYRKEAHGTTCICSLGDLEDAKEHHGATHARMSESTAPCSKTTKEHGLQLHHAKAVTHQPTVADCIILTMSAAAKVHVALA